MPEMLVWQLRTSSQAKTRSGIEPDIKNGSEIEMVPETQLIEEQLATQIEEASLSHRQFIEAITDALGKAK